MLMHATQPIDRDLIRLDPGPSVTACLMVGAFGGNTSHRRVAGCRRPRRFGLGQARLGREWSGNEERERDEGSGPAWPRTIAVGQLPEGRRNRHRKDQAQAVRPVYEPTAAT